MRAVCSACFGPPEDEACPGPQVSALFSVRFQPLTALPNGPFPCILLHPSQVPPKPLAVLLNPSLSLPQSLSPGVYPRASNWEATPQLRLHPDLLPLGNRCSELQASGPLRWHSRTWFILAQPGNGVGAFKFQD